VPHYCGCCSRTTHLTSQSRAGGIVRSEGNVVDVAQNTVNLSPERYWASAYLLSSPTKPPWQRTWSRFELLPVAPFVSFVEAVEEFCGLYVGGVIVDLAASTRLDMRRSGAVARIDIDRNKRRCVVPIVALPYGHFEHRFRRFSFCRLRSPTSGCSLWGWSWRVGSCLARLGSRRGAAEWTRPELASCKDLVRAQLWGLVRTSLRPDSTM